MVNAIRIFIEGDPSLYNGFGAFFQGTRARARAKRIGWSLFLSGTRNYAFADFMGGIRRYPDDFNLLLVDSEGPVTTAPREHLRNREGWDCKGIDDGRIHLMVQTMEAWFVADPDALRRFYKQGFHARALPKRADVEAIDKATLETALANATRKTSKKSYHKTHHAPKLLEGLDVVKVRAAAPHCDKLFQTRERFIESCP